MTYIYRLEYLLTMRLVHGIGRFSCFWWDPANRIDQLHDTRPLSLSRTLKLGRVAQSECGMRHVLGDTILDGLQQVTCHNQTRIGTISFTLGKMSLLAIDQLGEYNISERCIIIVTFKMILWLGEVIRIDQLGEYNISERCIMILWLGEVIRINPNGALVRKQLARVQWHGSFFLSDECFEFWVYLPIRYVLLLCFWPLEEGGGNGPVG